MGVLRIGHYRILESLGRGGSGDVYLAEDTRLRRKVALKILKASRSEDAELVKRFQEEAHWASVLNHPNVLTIYEIGSEDDVHFIASEYIEGETLRQRLQRGPIPLLEVIDIALGTARALAAAHEAWIVHRDIKPENIMLRPDRMVKVLDFGSAKLSRPAPEGDPLAEPNRIVGTLRYLSPEQVRGEIVDNRSDVFGLGLVLYEMVTGESPFSGTTALDVLAAIVEEEPPRLSEHFPSSLQRIVDRCLKKSIWERYQTASEVVGDLEGLRDAIAWRARNPDVN